MEYYWMYITPAEYNDWQLHKDVYYFFFSLLQQLFHFS